MMGFILIMGESLELSITVKPLHTHSVFLLVCRCIETGINTLMCACAHHTDLSKHCITAYGFHYIQSQPQITTLSILSMNNWKTLRNDQC